MKILIFALSLSFSSSVLAHGFVQGTQVGKGRDRVKIETIKSQDNLVSCIKSDHMVSGVVFDLFESEELTVEIRTRSKRVTASIHQEFATNMGWISAAELRVGQYLVNTDRDYEKIVSLSHGEFHRVYSFEVQPTHTFYAGGFLVKHPDMSRGQETIIIDGLVF